MLADTSKRQAEYEAEEAQEVEAQDDDSGADDLAGDPTTALPLKWTLQNFFDKALPTSSAAPQDSSMPDIYSDDSALAPTFQAHASEQAQQDSPLLNLPPELRTEIYQLAMKSPHRQIFVNSSGYDRSPLLQTCKAVRADALKLFYCTNVFTVLAQDFDYSAMSTFLALLRALKINPKSVKYYFDITGDPHWQNLVDWVKRYHAATEGYHSPARKPTTERILLRSVFDTARIMRGQDWRLVKKVMWAMRPALVDLDVRWAV